MAQGRGGREHSGAARDGYATEIKHLLHNVAFTTGWSLLEHHSLIEKNQSLRSKKSSEIPNPSPLCLHPSVPHPHGSGHPQGW